MFIEINIFIFEDIDLIIFIRISYINSYKIIFALLIVFSRSLIKQLVILKKLIIVSIYFYIIALIKHILLLIKNVFIYEFIEDYSII